MKPLNALATLLIAAMSVVVLGACSQTSNSSSPATAATTPGTCTLSWDGTYRDQYGRSCSASGVNYGCTATTYTPSTPYCGNSYTLPATGYYNSGTTSYYVGGGTDGCAQWTAYYGQTYVPVNLGGGQLMCVSWAYMQSTYASSMASWGAYSQPSYWYQMPPTVFQGGYPGYGYGYPSGYSYCQSNVSFGFSSGGLGAGVSLCF